MTKRERNLKLSQKVVQILQDEESRLGDILSKMLLPGEDIEAFSNFPDLVEFYNNLPNNPKDSKLGGVTYTDAISVMKYMRKNMGFNFDGYSRKEVEPFCLACVKKVNSLEIGGIAKWSDAFGDIDFASMGVDTWEELGDIIIFAIEAFGTEKENESQQKIFDFVASKWGVKPEDLTPWERELLVTNILAEYGFGDIFPHSKESL